MRRVFVLLALLALASCATLPGPEVPVLPLAGSAPSWERLARGIEYAKYDLPSPPLQVHALRIDFGAQGVETVVTPPLGPLGKTRGLTVGSFASEFGCVAAVNGGPFSPSFAAEGETLTLTGLSISEGRLVSPPDPRYAALVFPRAGGARVVGQSGLLDLSGIRDAIGGFYVVLESGALVGRSLRRAPRTAAGVSEGGRLLYLLVADGRRRGSVGLTERETGAWLAWLGAADGLCLDGGGSSAMALRRGNSPPRIVNVPIDSGVPGRQRVVGDCLGFRARP
ncbi:MAG: phosphodiester glycosidase family protein [Rectinemataceae bacterium]